MAPALWIPSAMSLPDPSCFDTWYSTFFAVSFRSDPPRPHPVDQIPAVQRHLHHGGGGCKVVDLRFRLILGPRLQEFVPLVTHHEVPSRRVAPIDERLEL